ncbi:hypothetical protein [Micromonospora rubida]|uniref:hypothetical protein n=1 Tax=Micromonospora rubida TaxID=2697657 RepID=UPI0013780876|nr:hypothetical protein [Micromonospora rubida]NBE80184.1 hypothetical protein [Micromonospora rubida]
MHEAEAGLSRELEKLVAERPGSAGVPCPHGLDGGVDWLSAPPDPDLELHPEKPFEDGMDERVAYFGIRGLRQRRQLCGHRPRLWHDQPVSLWDELSAEERVIMTNALEEAWLSGVIQDFLGHAEAGSAIWIFNTDKDAVRPLIPRFAAVTKDMIRRDLIELIPADRYDDWPNHVPMTESEIDAALAGPHTWMSGDATGPIMLMTTDHADHLLGR